MQSGRMSADVFLFSLLAYLIRNIKILLYQLYNEPFQDLQRSVFLSLHSLIYTYGQENFTKNYRSTDFLTICRYKYRYYSNMASRIIYYPINFLSSSFILSFSSIFRPWPLSWNSINLEPLIPSFITFARSNGHTLSCVP
jgi:hypothetical protein